MDANSGEESKIEMIKTQVQDDKVKALMKSNYIKKTQVKPTNTQKTTNFLKNYFEPVSKDEYEENNKKE